MIHAFRVLGFLAVALGLPALPQQAPRASDVGPRTSQVYVSVLGPRDVPVTGLSAADFVVREDGVSREVLRAGPATDPLQIVLVIDDSQAATDAIQPLREGLRAFVDALQGRAEIGIVTVADRATSLVPATTDPAALRKGIDRIFARSGSGAYLLDAVMDTSRGFTRRKAARPVIVAVTMEGVEFSNLHYQNVLDALVASGAALHVLAVGTPGSSMADEIRNRNQVIAEGTEMTGGRRDQLLTPSGLADALPRVAAELRNQYLVTYSRPESLIPPEKVKVTVSRPEATVRARTRAAGR